MELEFRVGDLLAADLPAIAHGVNCKGAMGAGIAGQIRDKFPTSYRKYRVVCEEKILQPGGMFVRPSTTEPVLLYNLASQNDLGADARPDWLRTSMLRMILDAEERKITEIGLPLIGCGIGGLNWTNDVHPIFAAVQHVTPIQLTVYTREHLPFTTIDK